MTPSMRSMVGSSCGSSTPTTTSTAFSPSWCSTVREIRSHWPRVEILIRADSHYCAPEVLDFCRAERLDFIFAVASTTTLRRHVLALETSTTARYAAASNAGKQRRYTEFYDGAGSWSRVERIIARVEAGPDGVDTRFIVTNLAGGTPRRLYENLYCARGQAEDRKSTRLNSSHA